MPKEDRILLTLIFSLILIIFLDFQAKKQYQSVSKEVKKISVEELVGEDLNNFKKNVEEGKILEDEELQKIIGNYNPIKQYTKEAKKEFKKELKEEKNIKKIEQLKQSLNEELKSPYLRNITKITLPQNDSNTTELFLYYPKFKDNKKTEMYQVKRKIKGTITPSSALNILQKGPQNHETGLVNAFYEKIQIKEMEFLEEEGIMNLYFDQNFLSKSSLIMNDRIQQICLTLKQFPQIKKIQIWIEEDLYIKLNECKRNFLPFHP